MHNRYNGSIQYLTCVKIANPELSLALTNLQLKYVKQTLVAETEPICLITVNNDCAFILMRLFGFQ